MSGVFFPNANGVIVRGRRVQEFRNTTTVTWDDPERIPVGPVHVQSGATRVERQHAESTVTDYTVWVDIDAERVRSGDRFEFEYTEPVQVAGMTVDGLAVEGKPRLLLDPIGTDSFQRVQLVHYEG